ncbi:xab2 [Symbiodinium sp. KB8]|nr:xab2 [Symbiodinium sp. KB8]
MSPPRAVSKLRQILGHALARPEPAPSQRANHTTRGLLPFKRSSEAGTRRRTRLALPGRSGNAASAPAPALELAGTPILVGPNRPATSQAVAAQLCGPDGMEAMLAVSARGPEATVEKQQAGLHSLAFVARARPLPLLSTARCSRRQRMSPAQSEADVAFEEELQRNPYSVSTWVSYAEAVAKRPATARNAVYERAVRSIPGSYKLWKQYLEDRLGQVRSLSVTDPAIKAATLVCERALSTMHKMPRIWIMYLRHIVRQRQVTGARRAFDRALRALPVTQHQHVWPLVRAFVQQADVPVSTASALFKRLVQFDPAAREDAVHLLLKRGRPAEAARHLAILVDDPKFRSSRGDSKHAMWMLLCETIAAHPQAIRDAGGLPLAADEAAAADATAGGGAASLASAARVERIFEAGIRRFSDEVGRLWCAHAAYHVRLGQFERARDIYEAALAKVGTVRDFSAVFDAYWQFEELLVEARAQALRSEVQLRLERLEALVARRPLLLSAVLLRQNPHNVREWLRRADEYSSRGQAADVARTLGEAVRTVDPFQAAGGRARDLWVRLAKEYEKSAVAACGGLPLAHGASPPELSGARRVFERAVAAPAKSADDVAALWCSWAEMEVRCGNPKAALRVMQRAVTPAAAGQKRRIFGQQAADPDADTTSVASASVLSGSTATATRSSGAAGAVGVPSQQALAFRSARSWALLLDLEEAVGTPETVAAAYDRALELGVATPRMVLSFADWLSGQGYHERSFRAFERGLAAFPWPQAGELWSAYLSRFVERYKGTKVERTRALFQEALAAAPPAQAKDMWLLLAAFEERYGSVRGCLSALDRASKQVAPADRAVVYRRWAAKAEEFYGVVAARQVWEEAADAVAEADAADVCLHFASLEARMGEFDRARAIFSHGAQFAGGKDDASLKLWDAWKELELAHGTRESFRTMAMRRREVQAATTKSGGYTEQELSERAAAMNRAAGGDGAATRAQKRQREPRDLAAGGDARAGAAAAAATRDEDGDEDEDEDAGGDPQPKVARGAEEADVGRSSPAEAVTGVAGAEAEADDGELDIDM